MDDTAIIDLYWSWSESAIEETAKKYGSYCTAIAMNILYSHEDSEECVNDTYLRTWNAIPPQRPAIFKSFLGRITRNLSLDKYKERSAKKRGGDEIPHLLGELDDCVTSRNLVEDELEAKELAALIDSFLLSIDDASRIVFVRRYWYADSITSISSRFRMSESKVKSMLFRARNKLRDYLEKEGVTI
jgi:RNA polymerase sigma-70 factor (ECF subfamily)